MRSGLLFPSWPATTHFRSLNSSVGMNGVRLDQIRYVRLNQIHVPESDQIADRSAALGCFFFFLSFLFIFLSRSPPSQPPVSFSIPNSELFLLEKWRALIIIDRTGSW